MPDRQTQFSSSQLVQSNWVEHGQVREVGWLTMSMYHEAELSFSFQCEVIIVVWTVFRSCINTLSASGTFLYQISVLP
jgi:hypothetical protein